MEDISRSSILDGHHEEGEADKEEDVATEEASDVQQ